MPNRIIKESICTSDSVDQLSWFEEVLFYRLIVNCDDYGRFDGRPAVIKNMLFPLKENVTVKTVSEAVKKLASAELVTLYEHEGKPYLCLRTWDEHQRIRAKRSKYPSPSDSNLLTYDSKLRSNDSESLTYAPVIQSNPIQSKSNTNPNPTPKPESFTPPTLDEVKAYCAERKSIVDPLRFWAYYDSGHWKDVKGNQVINWKQKLISWEREEAEKAPRPKNTGAACKNYPASDPTDIRKKVDMI